MSGRAVPQWTYGDAVFLAILYLPATAIPMLALRGRVFGAEGGALVGQLVGYALWFSVMALILRWKHGVAFWKAMAFRRSLTVPSIALGIALVLAAGLAARLLHLPEIDSPLRKLVESPRLLPLTIFAVCVAGPLAEELAFRGFLQPLLVRDLGRAAGVVLTAIPFGVLHAPQLQNSWRNVLLIIAVGIVFGTLRERSGSTLASSIAHATYNTMLLAAYLLGKRH